MAVCVPPEELVGYGTLLQYQNPLTEQWVTVAGTKDLTTPSRVREAIETTNGTSGGWRTRIPNPLASLEPQEFEMNFLSSQWFVLNSMFNDGSLYEWRLVMPDARQFYIRFCAFVSNMGEEIPMEDLVMSTIELTPSGGPSAGYLN